MAPLSSVDVSAIFLAALKIVVIVAVTELLCRTAWRRRAAMRHLSWTLSIVGILVVPVAGLWTSWWAVPMPDFAGLAVLNSAAREPSPLASKNQMTMDNLSANNAETSSRPGVTGSRSLGVAPVAKQTDTPMVKRGVDNAERAAAGGTGAFARGVTDIPKAESRDVAHAAATRGMDWRTCATVAWLVVAAVLFCLQLLSLWAAHALCRRSEPLLDMATLATFDAHRRALEIRRPLRLLVSGEIDVPVTFGAWRPCVVLPRTSHCWDSSSRRAALLHELAHVRRFDTATQVLGGWATAVFWWHPLAWYAAGRQRAEQERACDDVVLAHGCRASDYAEHLIRISQAFSGRRPLPSASVAMIHKPSRLRARLDGILAPHSRRGLTIKSATVFTAMALAAVLSIASIAPRATAENGLSEDSKAPANPLEREQENSPLPTARNAAEAADATLPEHALRRYGTTGVRAKLSEQGTAVTSDGRLAATAGPLGAISLWDITEDRKVATLVDAQADEIDSAQLEFSPDDSRLMVIAYGRLLMWDVEHKRKLFERSLGDPRRYIVAAVFSPSSADIAVSGKHRTFRIWDANTGDESLTLPVPKEYRVVEELAFSPQGNLIAWGTETGHIALWDVATGQQVGVIKNAHPDPGGIDALLFSPDGHRLYSGGTRYEPYETAPGVEWARHLSEITAWDVATGQREYDFQLPAQWEGNPMLGLSADGEVLYSLHDDKFAVWDAATGHLQRVMQRDRLGPPVGPAERIITLHGRGSRVLRQAIDSGDLPATEPAAEITWARLSDDGKLLITAGEGVRIWDASTGEPKRRLGEFGTLGSVHAIGTLSSQGLVFALGEVINRQRMAIQGQLRAWERYTGELQYAVRFEGRARNLAISPDGKLLALASRPDPPGDDTIVDLTSAADGSIEVLQAVTGNRVASLKSPVARATVLQFAPDSSAVATITESEFRIRDVISGEVLKSIELAKHRQIVRPGRPMAGESRPTSVYAAAVSPDLRWAVTTGRDDERVFVTEVETGVKHAEFVIRGMIASELAVSPDSRLLAVSAFVSTRADDSNSQDVTVRENTITIWDIDGKRRLLTLTPDAEQLSNAISFSADGKGLLSASGGTSVILWDLTGAYKALDD
jgi:WD40 repeat protein/beta-lactamase regulating signal transducer with metallopeptidase domain